MRQHARILRVTLGMRRENGFTVLETVVALGVILAAMLTLAYTANVGFSDAAYSRQRQTASGLANQTIEQVRALPFDTLKQGLSNFDNLGSDPNIAVVGPDYLFTGVTPNEKIPHGDIPLVPGVVPLVPHIRNTQSGTAATYKVSVYVTYFENNLTSNTFRVSVIVTWATAARKGLAKVEAQSIFYSGSGCLSTSTHPFAAPCQPFLFASGAGDEGDISITGNIDDLIIDGGDLRLGGATSNMQIEQISAIQGTSGTSGVSLAVNGQPRTDAGSQTVTSGADNDPAPPNADFSTSSLPAQGSTTLSANAGSGSTFAVTSSAGDTGSTTSTSSASAAPPHPCNDSMGTPQTDMLPCGASLARQNGSEFATLELWGASQKLGAVTFASVGASPSNQYVFTNRAGAPEFSYCPGTSGEGCVHADVTRSWGPVALGGLPDNFAGPSLPPGWTGYLLTGSNLEATASAEAGIGSAPPSATVSGTLSYYNGIGYTPLPLIAGPSVPIPIPPVHAEQMVNAKLLTVDITANLTTGGTQLADPAACGSPCTRNDASAVAESPIVGRITYVFTYDGSTIATLTVKVNLGTTRAKGTYKPAPSGA
jgi:type II secretory pathway pseudopilin PulG